VTPKTLASAVFKGRVRLHARRVALGATVLALVVYLLACTIADVMVVGRLNGATDARLATRLVALIHETPRPSGAVKTIDNPPNVASEDLDDAPILAWFVPSGATSAQRLTANAPALPLDDLGVGHLVDAQIAGRNLRLDGAGMRSGHIVVATSTEEVASVRNTLFIIEGVLAPVLLFALFLAASIIGRRAATPIERARLRQLEFTADASHELRTPLSVIEAEIGLALSTRRSASSYREALERVAGESKRLRSIVEDLLWLARLDSLPEAPPYEAVDLASIVKGCADRFSALALREELTISAADAGAFPALVLAPADWLDRLVSVLLDNACRYTGAGGRIELVVATSDDRVTITVDDNGPGIAEGERDRILQRFHRASNVPGGAGLGLSIANAVVQATNGEWALGTANLGGARIQASWPRFRADGGSEKPAERPVEDVGSTPNWLLHEDCLPRGDWAAELQFTSSRVRSGQRPRRAVISRLRLLKSESSGKAPAQGPIDGGPS
jgi:signal transduction histidine kinase